MQKILLIFTFSLICLYARAQQWQTKNALFAELGDSYQLNYSINYNRIVYYYNTTTVSVSAGASLEPVDRIVFCNLFSP